MADHRSDAEFRRKKMKKLIVLLALLLIELNVWAAEFDWEVGIGTRRHIINNVIYKGEIDVPLSPYTNVPYKTSGVDCVIQTVGFEVAGRVNINKYIDIIPFNAYLGLGVLTQIDGDNCTGDLFPIQLDILTGMEVKIPINNRLSIGIPVLCGMNYIKLHDTDAPSAPTDISARSDNITAISFVVSTGVDFVVKLGDKVKLWVKPSAAFGIFNGYGTGGSERQFDDSDGQIKMIPTFTSIPIKAARPFQFGLTVGFSF
jgi:hypothetical protein